MTGRLRLLQAPEARAAGHLDGSAAKLTQRLRPTCLVIAALLLSWAGDAWAEPSVGTKVAVETGADSSAPAAPVASTGLSEDRAEPANGARYRDLLTREARARGLPPAIADAVAFVESGYNPGIVGAAGELGLMQVMPSTAAMLGLKGPASALLDPATNVRFGVAYLAKAWVLANGDLCRALMKYRAGHGEERMTRRSVAYCLRARRHLASLGSPLADAAIPPLSAASPSLARPGQRAAPDARQAALAAITARFWAAHVARIRAIEARSERVMRGG